MAFLLMACCRHRSLLAARDGTAFKSQPSCAAVCGCLGRAIATAGRSPRYIVCDRGGQFDCDGFRKWCKRKGIKRPRYGAVGKHGSIAVVERAILTIKCLLHCLPYIFYRHEAFQRQLTATVEWYNDSRPYTWLGGKRRTRRTMARFPLTDVRVLNHEQSGHVVHLVRSLGLWYEAVRARS
jgi:hypothetical protein